jgi:hypothetical protein
MNDKYLKYKTKYSSIVRQQVAGLPIKKGNTSGISDKTLVLKKPARKSEGWLSEEKHLDDALKCRECHWQVFRGDKRKKMTIPQMMTDFSRLYVSKTGEQAPPSANCDNFKNWYEVWVEYYGGTQVPDYTIRDKNIYLRPNPTGSLSVVFDLRRR